MKRIAILLLSIMLLSLSGCGSDNTGDTCTETPYLANGPYFDGTVIEVSADKLLIAPFEDDDARKCSDRISVSFQNADRFSEGDEVRVHSDGTFRETYPATASGVTGVYLLSEITVKNPEDTAIFHEWQSAYANYSGDYQLHAGSLNSEKMYESKELHLPVYRFDDGKKLMKFRNNFKDVLTFDHGYDEIPSFDDAVLKYDEEFFGENSLFIVYVQSGSGSNRYGVKDIYCDGTNFQIRITETYSPEVCTCDMAGWFIMAEVSKSDIAGCENYDAIMR